MELSQFFTGSVVLVCAIHLAGMVGRRVFTVSAKSLLDDPARQSKQRSDWYCFFSCSELTGSKTTSRKAAQESFQKPQAASTNHQRKRQSRASASY